MEKYPTHSSDEPNVISFRPRPPYDYNDHETAYSDLGGRRSDDKQPPVEEPRPSFFDVYKPEPWQVEINRAYELSLDALTVEQLEQLSAKDTKLVAAATHRLLATLEHRSQVLRVHGNYEHPSFAHYHLTSQDVADEYAGDMLALRFGLMERPAVQTLESTYKTFEAATKRQHAPYILKRYDEAAVHLTAIHISDEGTIELEDDRKRPTSTTMLRSI